MSLGVPGFVRSEPLIEPTFGRRFEIASSTSGHGKSGSLKGSVATWRLRSPRRPLMRLSVALRQRPSRRIQQNAVSVSSAMNMIWIRGLSLFQVLFRYA